MPAPSSVGSVAEQRRSHDAILGLGSKTKRRGGHVGVGSVNLVDLRKLGGLLGSDGNEIVIRQDKLWLSSDNRIHRLGGVWFVWLRGTQDLVNVEISDIQEFLLVVVLFSGEQVFVVLGVEIFVGDGNAYSFGSDVRNGVVPGFDGLEAFSSVANVSAEVVLGEANELDGGDLVAKLLLGNAQIWVEQFDILD